MPNVKAAWERNRLACEAPGWVEAMIADIAKHGDDYIRIHVAGDFYSQEYINAWLQIVRNCPQTTFVAYTRSWNCAELLPGLEELSRENNFVLWFSVDSSMPQPPVVPGVRVAFLSCSDDDVPDYPIDLIFRDNPKTPAKSLKGVRVCPYEQHIVDKKQIQCRKCLICYKRKRE